MTESTTTPPPATTPATPSPPLGGGRGSGGRGGRGFGSSSGGGRNQAGRGRTSSTNSSSNSSRNNSSNNSSNKKARHKHEVDGIEAKDIFESREERGHGDRQSQFENSYKGLTNYIKIKVAVKEGRKFLLHIMSEGNEKFGTLQPVAPPSPATDVEDAVYKEQVATYAKEFTGLPSGKQHVCGVIRAMCSPDMRSKLESKERFLESFNKGDVLKVLSYVRQISTNFEEHIYPHAALATALGQLFGMRQGKDEPLNTYIENIGSQLRTIKDYGGSPGLHPSIVAKVLGVSTEEYSTKTGPLWETVKAVADGANASTDFKAGAQAAFTEMEKVNKRINQAEEHALEQFEALLILRNSNKAKYQDLRRSLQNDMARGNDNYPKTKRTAYELLSHHVPAPTENTNVRLFQAAADPQALGLAATDPQAFQFTSLEAAVFFHRNFLNSNWIILDTGSTTHVFCNRDLLKNIRQVDDSAKCTMLSNTGSSSTDLLGDFLDDGVFNI
mmetsp:Transcript_17782/g.43896  ORF Transcript_17782/g.43896 Transcript_17782/m.43896 type:complete len:499 (-) Transcript_17782:1877-3373(-)